MVSKDPDDFALGKPERLFNLTCTLLYASEGLTKKQILQTVRGYDDEYKHGGDNSTLERKFERDKESLREIGIRIETEIPKHEDENNQVSTYRIKREGFSWPKNVKLTPKQLALLNLAAEAWAGGSLSTDASRGITKLRALGVVGQSSDIIGISPKIHTFEPSFKDIDFAIAESQVIQFDYRIPKTGEIQTRTLQPWLMRQIAGAWLVLGFDELRKAPRNFMLRRIVSKVRTVTEGRELRIFSAPEQSVIDSAVLELDEHARSQEAVLKITPGSEAWFRYELDLNPSRKDDLLRLNYHDLFVLAEQLREYADQIEVIEPKELAVLVQEGFRKVADLHG
jgi:proteasome accessory factor B